MPRTHSNRLSSAHLLVLALALLLFVAVCAMPALAGRASRASRASQVGHVPAGISSSVRRSSSSSSSSTGISGLTGVTGNLGSSAAAATSTGVPDPPPFKPTCDVVSIALYAQPTGGVPLVNVPVTYSITLYHRSYWPPPSFAYFTVDLKLPTAAWYFVSVNNLTDPHHSVYLYNQTATQRINASALGWNNAIDACNTFTVTTVDMHNSPGRADNCTYVNTVELCARPSIVGDPQFAGLRGQTFQVHGIDGGIYNLVSTTAFQLNSRFVFLTGPRPCPVMPSTGRPSSSCWSHAGSYLSNLALLTAQNERALIEAGPAHIGFDVAHVNGKALHIGEPVSIRVRARGDKGGEEEEERGELLLLSTHEAALKIGPFVVEIENVDSFLNLRAVRVRQGAWSELLATRAHGLLGQTWQFKRYPGRIPEIEGEVDDYLVGGGGSTDSDMFSTDHVFNRLVVDANDASSPRATVAAVGPPDA